MIGVSSDGSIAYESVTTTTPVMSVGWKEQS
jgi:hypothetical protein